MNQRPFIYKHVSLGSSHAQKGTPCQDCGSIHELSDQAVLLDAHDGVSLSVYSELGASLAERTIVDQVEFSYQPSSDGSHELACLRAAYGSASNRIRRYATVRKHNPFDYATTAATALFDHAAQRVVWAQSGDSGMLLLKSTGAIEVVCQPVKGEQRNQTFVLQHPNDTWRCGIVEDVVAVIACTDGVFDTLTSPFAEGVVPNENARQLFELIVRNPKEARATLDRAFEQHLAFASCITDDKTLLVYVCPAAAQVPEIYVPAAAAERKSVTGNTAASLARTNELPDEKPAHPGIVQRITTFLRKRDPEPAVEPAVQPEPNSQVEPIPQPAPELKPIPKEVIYGRHAKI